MEQYSSIQQLLKKEDGQKDRKPIYPPTVIQAVFDGKTGASLEAILAQFNSVYVQYQGTPKDTRLIIPKEMRRAGLTITYMDMESNTITERANSAVQKDNDHWGLDVNWSRVDELSLSGDISVSAKGTWIINGKDTGVKALGPKGDTGLTPWLKTIDNKLHFSYDNVTWEPCSDYIAGYFRVEGNKLQISRDNKSTWENVSDFIAAWFRWNDNKIQISRDNKTWTDFSGKFADNVHIKGYVANYASLPNGAAQGDIYGVGPTYAAEDTAHTNPIYRYYVRNANTWVDNGQFTSIAAGVVQETGDSDTEVMSQKAVTEKLSELESKERSITEDVDLAFCDNKGNSIVNFIGGHINTKNFTSKKTTQIENNSNADFSICDENGNAIVDFVDGHIKTKKFSSKNGQSKSSNFPFGIKSSLYFYRSARLMRPNAQPLIIVIGQSNADGRADYTSAPTWLKDNNYQVPGYKVWDALTNNFKDYNVLGMTGNGGDVPGSDGSGKNKFAFDAFFAHQYLADNPSKTLYMVRTTLGDTGLYDQPTQGSRNWTWSPDTDNIVEGCNSLLLSLQEKVYRALIFAKDNNIELMPIAILWHQGEKDASSEASIKAYKTNLSNLISWVRGLFDMPHLAFINAYINGEYSESYARINPIFNEINKEDFYTKTVNMEGHYNMLPDNIHFNAQGLEYMGNQMYELFKQLV